MSRRHTARVTLFVARTFLLLLVAVSTVTSGLVLSLVTPSPATAAAQPEREPLHVRLTPSGFEPPTINVIVGQTVIFDNESGVDRTIVADDTTFDSGAVPAEGAFAVTLSRPGTFPFGSPGDPELRGLLFVGLGALTGAGSARVTDVVPDLAPTDVTDLAPHPDFGVRVSRTRLLVVPSATATVDAFNALLDDNDLTIVGGMASLDELVVATRDPGDHSAVLAAFDNLRANDLVKAASLDIEVGDENIPRPVPSPAGTSDPLATYMWPDAGAVPTSADGNWGVRDVRAPVAWNLLDAARAGTTAGVVALENGTGPHTDLDVTTYDPCVVRGIACAKYGSAGSDHHAQHVTGIIGARYDNAGPDATHTTGVVGVNPVAHTTIAVPRVHDSERFEGHGHSVIGNTYMLDQVLSQTDAGEQFAGLRAVNISMGAFVWDTAAIDAWWQRFPYEQNDIAGSATCGPGADDDDTTAATLACTPATLDTFRSIIGELAEATVPVLQLATQKKVIVVKSAGNDNDAFCVRADLGRGASGCRPGLDATFAIPVDLVNEFAAAREVIGASTPTALLVVEAHDVNGNRAPFSRPGGDISAPGVDVVSAVTPDSYGLMSGTSMAAPHVTGAISYLATVNPSATWTQLRDAVLNGARPAPGGGTRQLDVFGAEVKLGLLPKALDVNDWSGDGNRRVFYSPSGAPIATDTAGSRTADGYDAQLGPRRSDPNGRVDMRDFRAFRDAWLQTCLEGSAGTQAGSAPACPPQIALDGAADHPKKDGNGDRCVTTPTNLCQANEGSYSRFDANGDGRLDLYATAPVAITTAGAPTTSASQLTDLDVFQRVFSTTTSQTEGWTKADLSKLLVSSDIELQLAELWAAGATSVQVSTVVDGTATGPARTFAKPTTGPGGGMITVPVAPGGSQVELVASATAANGTEIVATPFAARMVAGTDALVSPCVARLELSLDAPALLPGKETSVTAQVVDCTATGALRPGLDARRVTFGIEAAGEEVPAYTTDRTSNLDSKGEATVGLRAGTGTGTFTLTAEVELPGGRVLHGETDVTVSDEITMRYRWRSSLDAYEQHGTTRWEGSPDCTSAGIGYCIESIDERFDPAHPGYVVERSGTLSATADGITLTEHVDGGDGVVRADFSWTDLNDGRTGDSTKSYIFGLAAGQADRYIDEPVDVGITPVNDDVWVTNLRSLSMLGYLSTLDATGPNVHEISVPGEFFLMPRANGSSFAFANDLDGILRFTPANETNAAAYQWCGTTARDMTEPPGYYAAGESPWVIGATDVERDTQYDPGDLPLPTTTGELRFDVAFTATMSIGGEAADPDLPSCDGPNPPEASFSVVNPAPIEEGEAVQFVDRSEDLDGDISQWAWDFGGAGSSAAQDPTFGAGFPDEGTYPVHLTVTDSQGHAGTFTSDVTVVNAAPTLDAVSPVVLATAEVPTGVSFVADDPGEHDRASLKVTLSSSNTSFGTARTVNRPAGAVRFELAGLPAGEYPLTATVTDDAGATATATAMLYVAAVPPAAVTTPPQPPVMIDARGCTAPVPLDAEEAEMFDRIRAQRERVGLPTLVVSTELTRAAQRHARDQLDHGTVSLTGSDGSSSESRARDAGYPRTAIVDEWHANTPTLAEAWSNMRATADVGLDTSAAMIGIARVTNGADTRWDIVVGNVVDCDEQPLPEGAAPVASVSAPTTAAEGITVTATNTSTDPDGDLATRTIAWGDGTIGGARHRYDDAGTYTITATATDEAGRLSTATHDVAVTEASPEVAITPRRLVAGVPSLITFTVTELAIADRPLRVEVSADQAGLAIPGPFTTTAGSQLFRVTPMVPGDFTLTLRATDQDGQVATTSQAIHVDLPPGEAPTAPDNVVLTPAPTCATGMEVIGQAAEQLALLNAYRARHGIDPVVAVPQLTVAAEVHAADMAANRFFAHEGSDGSLPAERAADAGYAGQAGENLGLRSEHAAEQMAGWIMSPGHHANLLDPLWKAVGIAAVNGPDGVLWANVFGDTITCPTGNEIPPGPRVLTNPAVAKPAGTLGTTAADTGPIAPTASDTPLAAAVQDPSVVTAAVAVQPPAVTALAVTISDRTPTAGQVLTVVNRSRTAGNPQAVGIATGSTPSESFAAGATRRFTLLDPGTFALDLSVTGYPSVPLALRLALPVTGDPRAPHVIIDQPADAVSGELVTLRATVTEPGGGAASGRPVRFSIGALSAAATADDAGEATTTLRADLTPGPWPVRAEVLTDAGTVAAWAETSITLGSNLIPVADAGGPYLANIGDALTLDGTGSFDADGEGLDYAWDLDGDGAYDDAAGDDPIVEHAALMELLCAGPCDSDVAHTIGLRVTDPKGGSSDDVATVTFTRDFAVVVSPEILTIVPGSANSFVVDVVTTSGYTGAVALSVSGLPTGATAAFDPPTVTPGEQSMLKITLPSDVGGVETIDLAITGTSGSLVRTANSVVDVVFGLPPRCTTSVGGTVLDAETGAPLAGAKVRVSAADGTRNVVTGTDGTWHIDAVSPSTTNQPGPVSRRVELDGYWYKDLKATATCGVPLELIDRLVPIHSVHVTGNVHVGREDPTDTRRLLPTDAVAPYTTATVMTSAGKFLDGARVDSDGGFEADVPLGYENAPISMTVQGTAPNFWPTNVSLQIADGAQPTVPVLIRLKCTARITGGRVIDQDGKPVAGAKVTSAAAGKSATSGPDGHYTIDADVPLGTANTSGSASLGAAPPANRPELLTVTKNVSIGACGDVLTADIVLPRKPEIPPVVNNYGAVAGTITDAETGLPLGGVSVTILGKHVDTAADGTFELKDLLVGTNSTTQQTTNASISKSGYWQDTVTVTVRKDQTATLEHAMTPRHTGTISGVVRDQVTGAVLAGAKVAPSGATASFTDELGRFTATGVTLGDHNAPKLVPVDVTLAGYWPRRVTVQVVDGTTASTEVALLRECATAEIRGIVVNAQTREPIAGATVRPKDMLSVTTGPDGRFAITGIRMQSGNTPWAVQLTASATGFVSQTKTVNVFCGARIEVGFGSLPANPGVITGTVVDAATGGPLPDVFVGAGFGGAVRTDDQGHYTLADVPTNDNGTPIEWEVSVVPTAGDPHLAASQVVALLPGETVTADFALDVPPPPNQLPLAVLGTPASAPEGSEIGLDARQSTDPEGGALTFAWDLDADGAFDDATGATTSVVLPVVGARTVSVQVTDPAGAVAVASVEVVATNVSPLVGAGDDVTLDAAGHLARTGTFVDPGADTFSATVDYGEGAGSQPLALDGGSFTLDHTYPAGSWTVTVWVCDGHGGCGQDVVGITVPQLPPPNVAPVATDVTASTPMDTAVAVTLAGTDVDGDALTYTVVDGPAHGTLTGSAQALTYFPADGYTGTDSFTYTVSDGEATSAPATVSITVTPPPNEVPIATDVMARTVVDSAVEITLVGVDADGDALTYVVAGGPAHGNLSGDGSALTYTPLGGYTGTDSFTYTVNDGTATSQPATVTITVTPPPNSAPVAQDVAATTLRDAAVAVTLSGTDPDGDALTYAVSSQATHGRVTGTAPALTYQPAAGYTGTDSFTYTVSDGAATSEPATVTITVTAPPAPATAELLLSDDNARRVDVRPLESEVLHDGAPMYVFVGPDALVPSIENVKFYLDDPQRKAAPFSAEYDPGFDFARTAPNRSGCKTCPDSPAYAFESNLLPGGAHTITAVVTFTDGRTPVVLTSTFTVADTTSHSLLVSTRADRSGAVPLAGATLKDRRYVFLGPAQDAIADLQTVTFLLDGDKVTDEALAPYDLNATADDGRANALDTRKLRTGSHTLEAIVRLPEGVTYRYRATFTVTR